MTGTQTVTAAPGHRLEAGLADRAVIGALARLLLPVFCLCSAWLCPLSLRSLRRERLAGARRRRSSLSAAGAGVFAYRPIHRGPLRRPRTCRSRAGASHRAASPANFARVQPSCTSARAPASAGKPGPATAVPVRRKPELPPARHLSKPLTQPSRSRLCKPKRPQRDHSGQEHSDDYSRRAAILTSPALPITSETAGQLPISCRFYS
jgi:hypothetical protein